MLGREERTDLTEPDAHRTSKSGVAVWLERPVRDPTHDPDSRSGGVAETIGKQIGVRSNLVRVGAGQHVRKTIVHSPISPGSPSLDLW